MKRHLISILLVVSMLASGMLVGCGTDTTTDTTKEKEVIEMTFEYLVAKSEASRGPVSSPQLSIEWAFQSALHEAFRQTIGESKLSGKRVEMDFVGVLGSTEVPIEALEKLARHSGDGLWAVSIGDWEWQFNERTGEVTAQNEEAAKFLEEEIPTKTYHNTRYGYYIDYPPSWVVDESESDVMISLVSGEALTACIFIAMIDEAELGVYGDMGEYMKAKLGAHKENWHQFDIVETSVETTGIPAMKIDYTCTLEQGQDKAEGRAYFLEYDGVGYEIDSIATQFVDSPYLEPGDCLLSDPYKTFRFQP